MRPRVVRGDAALSPEITRRVVDAVRTTPGGSPTPPPPTALDDLTARERDVLRCLGEGLANAEIASTVHHRATVKTHVSRVLMKLGLESRVQAAILVRDLGGV